MVTNAVMHKPDKVGLAVSAMVLTDLTLSVADAVIKMTLSTMPLAQFVFIRSCMTLPLLIIALKIAFPGSPLLPQFPLWAAVRSTLLLASLLLYYASLPRLDFSVAAAVYYTIPLYITLLAAVFLKERVGIQGWCGVAIGFVGVLLMLKPDAGNFNGFALLPLASAILYALAMVLTRARSRSENPLTLALVFNLLAAFLGGSASVFIVTDGFGLGGGSISGQWVTMDVPQWALVVLLSVMMLIGSVGTALAYQLGPASIISTWDFSYLAFAVIWGSLVFSERLDYVSIMGIFAIVGAGILVVRR